MPDLYPELEPYAHGLLDVGDGHSLYWECCGNPSGTPALVLHGGPGSGCSPHLRRYFDPTKYRAILFDQRGAGRSTPHASEPGADLSANTTQHLLADIERLRLHLGIDRWLVFGVSWGATLALAYAQRHPGCVSALVLLGATTTTHDDIEWLYKGLQRFFPGGWARFSDGLPADNAHQLIDAYHRRLFDPNTEVAARAASEWCEWEMAIASGHPANRRNPRYDDPRFRLAFARLVTHYFRHDAWLKDGELLGGMPLISAIPGVMVHGALDVESPLIVPWQLHRAWPASELVVVERSGHDARDPNIAEAVVAAFDRFVAGQ